ncbi:putative Ig domain-containing protein [Roseiconus nitratireducens]|uniref:putative Ig domain-containing protein n=1 Tax=Roseiconus nitratireducens TaxID=2605748 RepID=UPI001F47365B|nr:putative Ig domain-containing protein [Roseiconus nitratireducens]
MIEDGVTVHGGNGAIGRSGYWNTANNVSVLNRGVIDADVAGRTIEIRPDGGSFTNEGVLRASGGTLDVDGLVGNAGTVELIQGTMNLDGNYLVDQNIIANGDTLTLAGTWDNQAAIDLNNSTLNVSGSWSNGGTISAIGGSVYLAGTPSQIGSFSIDGATLYLDGVLTTEQLDSLALNNVALVVRGTLDNTNELLEIGPGTPIRSLTIDGGAILGGTVSHADFEGARVQDGRLGQSVYLDGFGEYVQVGPAESLRLSDSFTIEAWVYPTGPGSHASAGGIIVNKEGEYEIARFTDGTLQWAFANASPGWTWISTGAVIPEDTWTHVAISYQNGQVSSYLNGSLVHEYSGSGSIGDVSSGADDFRIGGRQSADQFFQGRIDDVRVWNLARSGAELAASKDAELSGTESGLAGYWKFNEQLMGAFVDSSPAGNEATGQFAVPTIGVTDNQNNRLHNVALDVDLSLSGYRDFLRVTGGLTLNGEAVIGREAILRFDGTQTFDGGGTVTFSSGDPVDEQGIGINGSYSTLTIGEGITIQGGNGTIGQIGYPFNTSSNVNVINRGTISATVPGRTIHIDPAGGTLVNEGVLRSDGGDLNVDGLVGAAGEFEPLGGNLDIDGSYQLDQNVDATGGSLTLRGTWTNLATLTLDSVSASLVGSQGRNAGTIVATAAADVSIQPSRLFSPGAIEVTENATVTLTPEHTFEGTLNLNTGGQVFVPGDFDAVSSAVVNVDVEGPLSSQFGRILIDGQAALNGTLNVRFSDDFQAGFINSFDLARYGSLRSRFDLVNLYNTPNTIVSSTVYESRLLRVGENAARWIDAGGGAWNDPENWISGEAPEIGEPIIIDAAGNYQISVSQPAFGGAVWIPNNTSLTLTGGSPLTLNGIVRAEDEASVVVRNAILDGQIELQGDYVFSGVDVDADLINTGNLDFLLDSGNTSAVTRTDTFDGSFQNAVGGVIRLLPRNDSYNYSTGYATQIVDFRGDAVNQGQIILSERPGYQSGDRGNSILQASAGTFINESTGEIISVVGEGTGTLGSRTIRGNFVNRGLIQVVDRNLSFTEGSLTNAGVVDVPAGYSLSVNGSRFNPSTGEILGDGSFVLGGGAELGNGTVRGRVLVYEVSQPSGVATVNEGELLFLYDSGNTSNASATRTFAGTFVNAESGTVQILPRNDSYNYSNATATLTIDFTNGLTNEGLVELSERAGYSSGDRGNTVLLVSGGALVNEPSGKIVSIVGQGTGTLGSRTLVGTIENHGVIEAVDRGLSTASGTSLKNFATINVSDGLTLTLNSTDFENNSTVDLNDSGRIDQVGGTYKPRNAILQGDGTFTLRGGAEVLGGTLTGNMVFYDAGVPANETVSNAGDLRFYLDSGNASSVIATREIQGGFVNLSDGILRIYPQNYSSNYSNGITTLTVDFTNGLSNAGVIELGERSGYQSGDRGNSILHVSGGTLDNLAGAKIVSAVGQGTGTIGTRHLRGNVVNNGIIEILDRDLLYDLGTLSNPGTINVGSGYSMTVTGARFNPSAGNIVGDGSFVLRDNAELGDGTIHGRISFLDAIQPDDATTVNQGELLFYFDSGNVNAASATRTLSGNFANGLEGIVRLLPRNYSSSYSNAYATLTVQFENGLTNAGRIELSERGGYQSGDRGNSVLQVGGTLLNESTGLIVATVGSGFGTTGTRQIIGAIDNAGTLQLDDKDLIVSGGDGITNSGTIRLDNARDLSLQAGDFTQTADGLLVGSARSNDLSTFAIDGAADFAGQVDYELLDGFQPPLGASFVPITYTSHTGQLTLVDPQLPGGLVLAQTYNPDNLTFTVAQPLRLAGDVAGGGIVQEVTSTEVDAVLAAAIQRWRDAGVGRIDVLGQDLEVRIANLSPGFLGYASGQTLWIDDDASGQGWFVDPTPLVDEEFAADDRGSLAAATDASGAGADLLTVVMHELGHVLGLPDMVVSGEGGVMNATIDVGIRRLPTDSEASQAARLVAPVRGPMSVGEIPDSRGKEFWLAFPGSIGLTGDQASLSLRITGSRPTNGTVEIPGLEFSKSFSVTPGVETVVAIPLSADLSFTSDTVTDLGVHVTSTEEVTVYGVSRARESTDAFLGLPTDVLGTQHVVLGYKNTDVTPDVFETYPGTEFAIVGTVDGTSVTVTPSVTTGARTAGVPYVVNLDEGQTYLLQNTGGEPSDLSGTVITSNRPVAVFGGHSAANIPAPAVGFADYLVEQLSPTTQWATDFITTPLATRGGDTFRVVASEDATDVSIDGAVVATLNRGEVLETLLSEAAHLTATAPVLVAQYANSAEFDGATADPFMMLVAGTNQYLGSYTVTSNFEAFETSFINLVVPDSGIGAVTLGGTPVAAEEFTAVGTSGYSTAQIVLEPGTHRVSGPVAFGASVYGFGPDESYGYPAGLAFDPDTPLVASGLDLNPESADAAIGTGVLFTAAVVDQNGDPLPGVAVQFSVQGANAASEFVVSNAQGLAQFTYEGFELGTDTVSATAGFVSDTSVVSWSARSIDVVIDSPIDGAEIPAGQSLVVSGSVSVDQAADLVSLKLGDSPVQTVDASGNFFTRITVSPGVNTLTVTAVDSLGQSSTDTVSIRGTQPQSDPTQLDLFSDIVSASFAPEYGRTSFNDSTDRLWTDLAIENAGNFPVDAPLFVAINNLSDPSVRVARPDGFTPDGLPYFEYTSLVDDGTLDPGESTASRSIAFVNPEGVSFTYDLVYFGKTNQPPEIVSTPNPKAFVGRPYQYSFVANDPNDDDVQPRLISGPASFMFDPMTGLLTGTPTVEDLGTHDVRIEVSDGRGGFAEQQFTLSVIQPPPNVPPRFLSTPPVVANVGEVFEYQPQISDADGDDVTLSLGRVPEGLVLNETTGTLSWEPSGFQAGLQSLTVIADDGRGGSVEQSFSVLVSQEIGDQVPIIVSTPPAFGISGQTYRYDVDAYDADQDPLTYSLLDGPAGMRVQSDTGELTWQVAEISTLDFEDLQHDGADFVGIDQLGDDPLTIYEREGYVIEALSPNLLGLGAYGTASPEYSGSAALANRTVTGVTELRAIGGAPFTLNSLDLAEAGFGSGAASTVTFLGRRDDGTEVVKTVTTDGGNFSPERVTFEDFTEVNSVRWTQSSPFHQIDNVVVSSTLRAVNQQHVVTVQVDDGRGGIDTQSFTLFTTDTPPNSDPVIDSTPPLLATVGQPYGYFLSASDPDFDAVTLVVASGPEGMQIDETGLLTWTPDTSGPQAVLIRASDGRGGATVQSFVINVGEPENNLPPQINATPNTDAVADVPYEYQVIASDPNGDFLSYELLNSPEGMVIDDRRGLITWTPTEDMIFEPVEDTTFEILGTTEVTVEVSDSRGGTDQQTFTILVRAVDNLPPRLDSLPPSEAEFGEPYIYDADASDLDGDTLTYSLVAVQAEFLNESFDSEDLQGLSLGELLKARGSLNTGVFTIPEGMSIDADTGVLTWTPGLEDFTQTIETDEGEKTVLNLDASGDFGVLEIIIRVEDGNGGFDLQQFPITVYVPNGVPLITSEPTTTAVAELPYRYTVVAQDPENEDLSFELVGSPTNASIDETGVLNWTPTADQVGTQTMTIRVSDPSGGETTQSFDIEVAEVGANAYPFVFSELPSRVRLGGTLLYRVEALDPNGDPLAFTVTQGPSGMTVGAGADAPNLVRWTPTNGQVGTHDISLQISDGRGGVITQTGSIDVVVGQQNAAPAITSNPAFTAVLGQMYRYDVSAVDPDGDFVAYSLATKPVGMSINDQTGEIRWTPGDDQLDSYNVVVEASDPFGGIGRQSFTVSVRPVNSSPAFVTTPPTQAYVDRVYGYGIGAEDPDGDPLGIRLLDGPEGIKLDDTTGVITWRPGESQIGSHPVSVEVFDAQGGSAKQSFEIVVDVAPENIAPTITSTPPTVAQVDVALAYLVTAIDPENSLDSFALEGDVPDGVQLNANTGLLTWTPAGTQTGENTITVVAIDAEGAKARQTFKIDVRAANRLPIITGPPVYSALPGETYRMNFPASDPDGDRLTYVIEEGPAGMMIDANGRVTWDVGTDDVGTHPVSLTAGDAFGLVRLRYDLVVREDSQAPQVQVSFSDNPAEIGSDVTVIVTAVDDIRVASVTATVNGEVLVLDSRGRATLPGDTAGSFVVSATATDSVGNRTTEAATLRITDPSVVGDPEIEITSPTIDQQITGPISVTGTINDPDLAYYTIEVAPLVGDGDFVEVFRGTGNVADGELGTFDPSMLQNDEYLLRIYAVDSGGNDAEVQVPVSVTGDLKLGNFTLSFTDLTVPVSGVPIVVSRTYDTLDAANQSDLGYGWRLNIHDTDLRTSVPKSGLEDIGIYNRFFYNARVYVTTPGGGREGFTFEPEIAPGIAGAYLGIWRPKFVPDEGVTSRLEVPRADLMNIDGEFVGFGSGWAYNPSDSIFGGGYTLTTKEGLVYEINGDTGDADLIRDRNGNKLMFEETGIRSSTGAEIQFERDGRGRITAVIDPEGNRIEYGYSAAGDLVSVTDREGNTTEMVYRNDRPHYLEEVIDPLGRVGVKSIYDDDGRLSRMVDADGQEIAINYNPDNFIQTVADQLGNETTYEYDTYGNVVTEIDAEGLVTNYQYGDTNDPTLETAVTQVLEDGTELTTSYQYDSRGNVLLETDPKGNTTRYTYNSFGDVVSTTDANGNTTSNSYDSNGNLLATTDADGLRTEFNYDSSGNPTRLVVGSNVTLFQYDGAGRVTRQEDATGAVRSFTYDENGNQLTETVSYTTSSGPSTVVTENEYDRDGRVTSTTVKQNGVILTRSGTVFDAVGNPVQSIDALGRITKFLYDDRGQLTETIYPDDTPGTDADNPRTKTQYDAAGQVIAQIDEAGRVTRFEYDSAGRQTKTIFPAITAADPDDLDPSDNPFTESVYDRAGRTVAEIDELGNRTQFVYNAAGNVTQTILPDDTPGDDSDNPRIIDRFDSAGRRTASIDPLGNVTKFVYTAGGLLSETILPDDTPSDDSDNARNRSSFDSSKRLASRTDANGNVTEYEYDDASRLTAVIQYVTDPATQELKALRTEYAYNELGNLVTQTDANDHSTTFEYDGLGRRTATVLPMGQRSETEFDAAARVIETTDFNGKSISFDYDVRDRLTAKNFPDGSATTFTYTVTGLRETATDGRGTTEWEYDERDRLVSRTDPDGAEISYTYDATGNRTSLTTAIGSNDPRTTSYTFDALGRTETVTDPEGLTTTYVYDAAGRPTEMHLPNGTAEFRSYDAQSRLTMIEHKNTTTDEVFASFEYDLDKVGNRIAVTEHDGRRVEYDYDELYRLLSEDIYDPGAGNTPSRTIDYVYDDVGNRLERDDSGEGATTYLYDDNDRLLEETLDSMVTTYEYDDNGNTLRKAVDGVDQVRYEWDFENRLIAADTNADGTNDVAYEYDVDGIRVSKTLDPEGTPVITQFLIDANRPYSQVLEEYTPGGILKVSYVHGLDLISQNRHGETGKSFYHVDGLGSTRALTNGSGIVTDSYIYDAFGQTIGQVGSSGNVYLFAGEQRDLVLGLDYLRARYVSPSLGRFVSRDSFEGVLNDPLTLHKFAYAHNSPTNLIDPSGNVSLSSVVVSVSIATTVGAVFGGAFSGGLYLTSDTRVFMDVIHGNVSSPSVKAFSNAVWGGAKRGALAGAIVGLAGPAISAAAGGGLAGGAAVGGTAGGGSELGVQIFDYATGEIQEFDIEAIALSTGSGILLGGLFVPKVPASGTVTVTQFGYSSLKSPSWVMIGGRNRISHLFSGTKGGAHAKPYNSGVEYQVLAKDLKPPALELDYGYAVGKASQFIKNLLGQRIYTGPPK